MLTLTNGRGSIPLTYHAQFTLEGSLTKLVLSGPTGFGMTSFPFNSGEPEFRNKCQNGMERIRFIPFLLPVAQPKTYIMLTPDT